MTASRTSSPRPPAPSKPRWILQRRGALQQAAGDLDAGLALDLLPCAPGPGTSMSCSRFSSSRRAAEGAAAPRAAGPRSIARSFSSSWLDVHLALRLDRDARCACRCPPRRTRPSAASPATQRSASGCRGAPAAGRRRRGGAARLRGAGGARPARATGRPRPGAPRLVGRASGGPRLMASREIAFSVSKTPMPCSAAASK